MERVKSPQGSTVFRILRFVGSLVFPGIIIVMVFSYREHGEEPGGLPYCLVDYVPIAACCYTLVVVVLERKSRIALSIWAASFLLITCVLAFFAGMYFTGNYL
jgi:hypothetical protein